MTGGLRALLGALALGVGTLAWWAGPADWTAGSGRLTVRVDGVEVGAADVQVGGREALAVGGLSLPAGLPVDAPIRGVLTLSEPAVERVDVRLDLPDGREMRLPAVSAGDGVVHIARQPLRGAREVLGLLALVAILWVSEVVPLFVGALLVPVVLVGLRVSPANEALAPFFSPVIALFLGGFVLADALSRVGLDLRAARAVVRAVGHGPRRLYAGVLVLAAVLSMGLSNTGTCALLIPVAIAITAPLPDPAYRRALVLGLAWATSIGGIGSPVGTPANALALAFIEQGTGQGIGFWGWFTYGLPLAALMLPVMGVVVWMTGGIVMNEQMFRPVVDGVRAGDGSPLSTSERRVLLVFAAVVAGWLSEPLHGVHAGIVSLGGAVALGVLGQLDAAGLRRIGWESLLTFGGGLSLGAAMVGSGASDALAVALVGLGAWGPAVGVFGVAAVTLALTAVASNTAAAAVLIPVAWSLAGVLGVNPVALVIVVALASSLDFALVVGTPPTMLAHATGLFTSGEIFRRGIALDLLGLLLLVGVVVPLWGWFGVTLW